MVIEDPDVDIDEEEDVIEDRDMLDVPVDDEEPEVEEDVPEEVDDAVEALELLEEPVPPEIVKALEKLGVLGLLASMISKL